MNTKLNCLTLLTFLILTSNASGQEAAMEKKGPDSVARLCESAGLGLPFEQISLDNGSDLNISSGATLNVNSPTTFCVNG